MRRGAFCRPRKGGSAQTRKITRALHFDTMTSSCYPLPYASADGNGLHDGGLCYAYTPWVHFACWKKRNRKFSAPPKTLPLLAFLLLHSDQPVNRETLAFTLWPDETETNARANVRRHETVPGRGGGGRAVRCRPGRARGGIGAWRGSWNSSAPQAMNSQARSRCIGIAAASPRARPNAICAPPTTRGPCMRIWKVSRISNGRSNWSTRPASVPTFWVCARRFTPGAARARRSTSISSRCVRSPSRRATRI